VPYFGESIVTLLWGGYSVGNPTLNRFFSLHYLLPFVIAASSCCTSGRCMSRARTTGRVEPRPEKGPVAFTPYTTIKDLFRRVLLLIFYAWSSSTCRTISRCRQLHSRQSRRDARAYRAEWYYLPF